MRVTKRQVERLAKAVVAYDEARTAVMGQKATRLYHTEPVTDVDELEAIAKAVGEKVATFESETVAAQFLGVNKPAVSAAVINGTSCVGFLVERTV